MSDVSSAPPRRGIHVPTWVFVTVGGVLLFGIAFAIGRRSERRNFDGGRFDHAGRHGLGILIVEPVERAYAVAQEDVIVVEVGRDGDRAVLASVTAEQLQISLATVYRLLQVKKNDKAATE